MPAAICLRISLFGRSGQPQCSARVPPRDVAEFRVMDTAALYFDFQEGGLAF